MAQSPDTGGLSVTLGGGLVWQPTYPGSSGHDTRATPYLRLGYGRFFAGAVPGPQNAALGLGATLYRDTRLSFGLSAGRALGKLRDETDDPRLAGVGDVPATTWLGLQGAYTGDSFRLSTALFSDAGNQHLGRAATLDAAWVFRPLPQVEVALGPGLSWGSAGHNQRVFGIDDAQALRSHFPSYRLGSGVNARRLGLAVGMQLSPAWQLGLRLNASRLAGSAADSPLVEDRSQSSVGLLATYTFGRSRDAD
jgi:outer membrane protein